MDKALSNVSWSLVQSFLAVAQSGSLSEAARSLGASQPTLGRQIKALEQQLGLTLFQRQPKGLMLTQTGQALVDPAIRMADAMRGIQMTAAGRADPMEGTVRITASDFTAMYHLPPIIARIRAELPALQVEIAPTDRTENLLFREADIAVRMHESTQLDVIQKKLGGLQIGVFAATSYLDRVGRPADPEDLLKLDLVGYDKSERIVREMRQMGWAATRDWFATRCDSHPVNWELVRAGCGAGFAQINIGEEDPLVERLLPSMPLPGLPVWLAAHEGMRNTPRIRMVWDLLEDGLMPIIEAQGTATA